MDEIKEIKYSISKQSDRLLFPIIKDLIERENESGGAFGVAGDAIVYFDRTENIRYVYSLDSAGVTAQEQKVSMGNGGASWFREIRGDGAVEDTIKASNKWQTLINELSEAFYAGNPLLYYEDTETELNSDPETIPSIKRLIDLLFNETNISVLPIPEEQSQVIYAASLRLAAGTSAGVPQPVLGKMYFSLINGKLDFLTREESSKLEENLKRVQSGSAAPAPKAASDFGAVVNSLETILKDREHLEKYLLFNKDNDAVVHKMVEKEVDDLSNEDVEVEISKVTINTLFLITVKAANFNIFFNAFTHVNTPVLHARVLFDKVTLTCMACDSGADLISANTVSYKTEKGEYKKVEIVLGKKIKLRTDSAEYIEGTEKFVALAEEMRKYVFSKHLYRVSCDACGCRDACVGYVCEDKQLEVNKMYSDNSVGKIRRCADCVYPESFVIVDGVPFTTDSVFFDVNTRRLRVNAGKDGGKKDYCTVCGRAFYREADDFNDTCDLCTSLASDDEIVLRQQKALYAKYAGLLPLRYRAFKKDKRCAEDQSMIVFKIQDVYYVFDKIAALVAGEDYLTGKVADGANGEE